MTAVLVLVLRVALAIALYAFLGWALSMLWQDVKQQGDLLASQKRPAVRLLAKLENGQQLRQHYAQLEITIGRDPNCDLSVLDEAISAHHARISHHHAQWWLADLNSTNGTFIGKSRVAVPIVLISGDQFRCGNTVFTVEMDGASEPLELS